jgi:hypothetical protein
MTIHLSTRSLQAWLSAIALTSSLVALGFLLPEQPAMAQVACLPDESGLDGGTSNPALPTDVGCYELYWNNRRVGIEPSWTRAQAIANLEWNKQTYPDRKVAGYFNANPIGYQLYWNGEQVGFEPSWSREQAIANLQWNIANHPDVEVKGVFNGMYLESGAQTSSMP